MRPLLLCLPLLMACPTDEAAPAGPPPIVLMVSWDTTRADALDCYAEQNHWQPSLPAAERPTPQTPVACGLAAEGVRFAWALSHAPTTLNSHASIFSGQGPHRHRVVRNGYPIPAEVPLLSERFQQAGWHTMAIIGSSALEQKMGLDRGFDLYQDPGDAPAGGMLMLGADQVTQRALEAIDAHRADPAHQSQPIFLFAHYYDPHMPWFTAPPDLVASIATHPYTGPVDGTMASIGALTQARVAGTLRMGDARQARALYLAQVAWADRQLGVLLQGLSDRGLMEDSLVVLLSDHGETLEENPTQPYTHGPWVGLADIHVPWILRGTGRMALPAGAVVQRQVRMVDVAPTVMEVVGLEGHLGDGESVAGLWKGKQWPAPPSFAEATKPMARESKEGWNNLPFERSVAEDGRLLRVKPRARVASLHKLAGGEPQTNEPALAQRLLSLVQTWDAAAPGHRAATYDEETRKALVALGYLPPGPTDADPAAPEPAPAPPPSAAETP